MSPCKEYFKKVDTDYVVFCKNSPRNYIIRMLRCRRHTHIWNVGRYWSSNLISFIYFLYRTGVSCCTSLQYMHLTFKQQPFDPETVRYLLADLQLIRE